MSKAVIDHQFGFGILVAGWVRKLQQLLASFSNVNQGCMSNNRPSRQVATSKGTSTCIWDIGLVDSNVKVVDYSLKKSS